MAGWTVADAQRRRYRFNADERRNAPIDSDAGLVIMRRRSPLSCSWPFGYASTG